MTFFQAWWLFVLPLVVLLIGAVMVYAVFVAPRRIERTVHRVSLANLPAELTGTRVVQLSDLHVSPLVGPRHLRRLVALVNDLQPHVVVLTGDFVSAGSLSRLREAAPELRALTAPLGVFACLGNHDHWEDPSAITVLLEDVGISVLNNRNVCLTPGLYLAGVDDAISGRHDLPRALTGVPREAALILLSHNPIVLDELAERPCLVLAGHTHGGQILLPWLGPRRTAVLPGVARLMDLYEGLGVRLHGGRLEAVSIAKYIAGWYQSGQASLYVNRGIGFGLAFPGRLNCPPEIACFDLVAPCVADEANGAGKDCARTTLRST